MNHYRRLPAIAVLVAAFGLSFFHARVADSGNTGPSDLDHATLEQLEQIIATGAASPSAWFAYGRRLDEARAFSRAAMAYERVIEAEPYHRPARFQLALSLAAADDADRLLAFLREQVYIEPKLVAELMDRAETQKFLAHARFASLQKEARAQAMD